MEVIKKHQGKIEQLFGGRKPVLVFDREGWDVSFLKELDERLDQGSGDKEEEEFEEEEEFGSQRKTDWIKNWNKQLTEY